MVPFICLAYAMLTELSLATNVKLAFGLTTGIAVVYPLNAKCAAPPGARRLETDIAPPQVRVHDGRQAPGRVPHGERALGAAKCTGADPTRPAPTPKHYVPEILCTGLSIAGAYLLFM